MLILQHQDNAPPGLLLDVLGARRLAWRTAHLDRAERLPHPHSVALAVVLGSDHSADDTQHQEIAAEIDWLRSAHAAGTAILGVGFGAQALAVALGGGVQRADKPRRGWRRVSTEAPQIIGPGPWFAWHDDVIRVPRGAQILAYDDNGPQAYRVGKHLGVQFHPEATPEIITNWVYGESRLVLDTQGVLEATSREFKDAAVAAHHLFSTFAASVQSLQR